MINYFHRNKIGSNFGLGTGSFPKRRAWLADFDDGGL